MYIGVSSSVLCVGAGLVPEDYRIPHLIIAICFFFIMTVAAMMPAWSIWKKEGLFSRQAALHGFTIPIFFIIFMIMPKGLMAVKRAEGAAFTRPEIWWLPFFEWCIFFTLTSWILSISIQILEII